MEQLLVLTNYISSWGWQIIAIIFLIGSTLMFALPRSLITQTFYITFFLIFWVCEFKSLKRQKEVYRDAANI